jgi:hypothetical protein
MGNLPAQGSLSQKTAVIAEESKVLANGVEHFPSYDESQPDTIGIKKMAIFIDGNPITVGPVYRYHRILTLSLHYCVASLVIIVGLQHHRNQKSLKEKLMD